MAKTIIVSNRLPVKTQKIDKKLHFKPSEGGLATGLGSIYKQGDNIWVGWSGMVVNSDKEKKKITQELKKDNMLPVFLTKNEIRDYYEGFSNETLWPNFHYFMQYVVYEQDLWEAYIKVNQKFCNEIMKVAEKDDIFWIHDYQLLLLPQMIREKLPEATIGFFQHIPFPSYEVFRTIPWRREILKGMLGSDLIGFHTYDDMRHFLSSVNRLVGIPNSQGYVESEKRRVRVESFPMGIDYDKYASSAAAPETLEKEVKYRTSLGNRKMILSIDRLDYSKGIPVRLKAFEEFFEQYPEYLEKVTLFMVVVPSRDQVEMYKHLKEDIDLLIGRINGKYGTVNWIPVRYFYRSFPLESLSAFYRIADVALVTPLRDGMNLVCKEYIASKLDKKGVLILSEMAGSSKELSDAILINPTDINQIIQALHRALTMPVDEQIQHMDIMQKSLRRYNIHHWVNLFMDTLKTVKEEQRSNNTRVIDEETLEKIKSDYREARQRLIFLDYDGTLVGFNANPEQSRPDTKLISLLKKLLSDDKNRVVIVTGRSKSTIEGWLSHIPLDFICEHGVWVKKYGEDWQCNLRDHTWKNQIKPILEMYVDRTPASFIEEKDHSLVWHYRKVETGLGELRTRELSSHLKYISSNSDLQVLEGDMVVEIKSREVNKGKSAVQWLNDYPSDFILAIGDDVTDEDTFINMPENAYTIKVGARASAASYFLNDYNEVRTLLKKLIK